MKKIKAWAVIKKKTGEISTIKGMYPLTLDIFKLEDRRFSPDISIVPCTITYKLPAKPKK